MLKHAETEEEIARCFAVMSELRNSLRESDFVGVIRHQQAEGFRLAYLQDGDAVVAVAGYRIMSNLFGGKHLYVDDLVTAERVRSQGFGHAMMAGLRDIARQGGCKRLILDSGTQRTQAHKFYFREGLIIDSFHFNEKL